MFELGLTARRRGLLTAFAPLSVRRWAVGVNLVGRIATASFGIFWMVSGRTDIDCVFEATLRQVAGKRSRFRVF